ncbi:lipopolysaccharide export system permease protein [Stella humosa]|uniref:Lipopolysaccharide export system permease protein n=1 Tax=Stella humosa TaxID=94 RepID=A0A3N1M9I1_9PROT|nr:LptF/LptG family permease [Stella humosa]ROQ00331.1 lipopolysaccharide export system permease protein [Stella humosa]BBK30430.1 hypothetical protein STHU_10640 [Stella humosa]
MAWRRPRFLPRLIDRYLLAEAARPLAVSLGVVLTALLLERLLRLFNLLAHSSGALESVVELLLNLIPHYLGLALPAAFFISIFFVIARLSEESELEAMLSAGLSIARIAAPLLWVGVVLSLFSMALFGFMQPYSRYAYRAVLHAAVNAGWDARVEPSSFVKAAKGFTVTADRADDSGTYLEGVFAQRIVDGIEEVFTAESGRLALVDGGQRLVLRLKNGQHWRQPPAAALAGVAHPQAPRAAAERPSLVQFTDLTLNTDFNPDAPPYRTRGDSERELTMIELWQAMHQPAAERKPGAAGPMPRRRLAAEFHTRIVRALSLPLLPLLAIPLGMAAKRGRRGSGLVMAAVILVLYHHGIQLGQSLATTGRLPPVPAVWVPFTLFTILCLWLFRSSQARPGQNSFTWLVERIELGLMAIRGLFRRRRTPAAGPGAQ